ncbi:MAG: RNA polymerase sigma factor [Saprospiraceae bacterium]|nr:RNA polymerase sigma factor [Saprospiraceae bacterium]MDW8228890.1 RNA polymerase sigma factor [Saprospiraceae bacterium]
MSSAEIEACLRGNRRAQRALYERYKGRMFAVCLRYAGSHAEAEDICQEGFVRVFRDLAQYDGRGPFEGWMRKVFVNAALQHLEKQRRRIQTDCLDGIDVPDDAAAPLFDDTPPAERLIHLLQQLPPGFRTVFNLYVLEGYTHPEIAEILGISVGTSKSQLLRAKAHLRRLLEKSLIE